MKRLITFVILVAAAVALAETVSYNDLGDFAGQTEATSGGFWDTTGRGGIAVERTASEVGASGFDSRTRAVDVSDAAIDVTRTPFGLMLILH